MNGEFRYTGLVLAGSVAVALIIVAGYRFAIYRADRRLRGRSTRDRERNLPAILRFDRWLKRSARAQRDAGRRRRRGTPRDGR